MNKKLFLIIISIILTASLLGASVYLLSNYFIKSNANLTQESNTNNNSIDNDEGTDIINNVLGFNSQDNNIIFNKTEAIQFTKYNGNKYYFDMQYFEYLFIQKWVKLNPNLDNINLSFKVDDINVPTKIDVSYIDANNDKYYVTWMYSLNK